MTDRDAWRIITASEAWEPLEEWVQARVAELAVVSASAGRTSYEREYTAGQMNSFMLILDKAREANATEPQAAPKEEKDRDATYRELARQLRR